MKVSGEEVASASMEGHGFWPERMSKCIECPLSFLLIRN
jgi:hypothetical protein